MNVSKNGEDEPKKTPYENGVEYEYRGFRYRVAVDGVVSGADTFDSKNKKLILYTDKE